MKSLLEKKTSPKRAHEYFQAKNQFTTGPVELSHLIKDGDEVNIVDLRAAEDFQKEHMPGALNLPQAQWDTEQGLSKDKTNILVCYSQQCHLASKAGEKFSAKDYSVMEMEGGFAAWKDNGLPIEKA